jgi:hypothetical protein
MTFADPRELRRRRIATLRGEIARATDDDERVRLEAELRELTRFRWKRLFWPGGPHQAS